MKRAIQILIFLLVLSFESLVQAGDCEVVDLRSSFGPVNNQQDIGWCYAYTAADLVNFHFANVLQGKKISPFHLALLYNANEEMHFSSEGGSTKMDIQLALEPKIHNNSVFNKGICYQSTDQKIFEGNSQISIREFYQQLKIVFNLYQAYASSKSEEAFEAFKKYYIKIGKMNSIVTKISPEKLFVLFENSNTRNLGINFLNLFCDENDRFVATGNPFPISLALGGVKTITPKMGPSVQIQINSPAILVKEIKSLLDDKKIPVGIGFYYRFLKEDNPEPGGDFHAAIVVGKEKIDNRCYFIVRNSWGDCPDKKSEFRYSQNVTKCEKGYLWIKEEILSKNLDSIEYIK